MYFPPHSENTTTKVDETESLIKSMPDPPTTEPGAEDEPTAKKQKVASEDEDWEAIEKPAAGEYNEMGSSQHGFMTQSEMSDAMRESEAKEIQATAFNVAESGGGFQPPENMLSKDW